MATLQILDMLSRLHFHFLFLTNMNVREHRHTLVRLSSKKIRH